MKNDVVLMVKDLKAYFSLENKKTGKAVDGIDFTIKKGEAIALVGESGSGKSVTALSVMRLVSEHAKLQGSIQLAGRELLALSTKQMNHLRGNEAAMIFQEPMSSFNPAYTIGIQLIEPLRKHKKVKKKEAKIRAKELLAYVGFSQPENILRSYPHQLSGGMLQRVMIAMAVSCSPRLLIADEPTTALDAVSQGEVLKLINKLKEGTEAGILLITHDFDVAAEAADYIYVMYNGQIVESAATKELFIDPLHPYTEGLLRSIPNIEEAKSRLDAIPEKIPASFDFSGGCRFAPRCAYASFHCKEAVPVLEEKKPGHWVRCILNRE